MALEGEDEFAEDKICYSSDESNNGRQHIPVGLGLDGSIKAWTSLLRAWHDTHAASERWDKVKEVERQYELLLRVDGLCEVMASRYVLAFKEKSAPHSVSLG